MARAPETQAGSESTVCLEKEAAGTWEVRASLIATMSMPIERGILREAKAGAEVGPTRSTLSMGKPCTRGRGWAGEALSKDTSSALGGGER